VQDSWYKQITSYSYHIICFPACGGRLVVPNMESFHVLVNFVDAIHISIREPWNMTDTLDDGDSKMVAFEHIKLHVDAIRRSAHIHLMEGYSSPTKYTLFNGPRPTMCQDYMLLHRCEYNTALEDVPKYNVNKIPSL